MNKHTWAQVSTPLWNNAAPSTATDLRRERSSVAWFGLWLMWFVWDKRHDYGIKLSGLEWMGEEASFNSKWKMQGRQIIRSCLITRLDSFFFVLWLLHISAWSQHPKTILLSRPWLRQRTYWPWQWHTCGLFFNTKPTWKKWWGKLCTIIFDMLYHMSGDNKITKMIKFSKR